MDKDRKNLPEQPVYSRRGILGGLLGTALGLGAVVMGVTPAKAEPGASGEAVEKSSAETNSPEPKAAQHVKGQGDRPNGHGGHHGAGGERPPRINPERKNYIVPCGAESLSNFHKRCIGCLLCVSNCTSRVLNTSASHLVIAPRNGLINLTQPAMSFEKGYCRPECTKCSEVCPTGAIAKVTPMRKASTQIGIAVWNREACRNSSGHFCNACSKICPSKAITVVDIPGEDGKRRVMVDTNKCRGCGGCEYICPARPRPAMCVQGLPKHRSL